MCVCVCAQSCPTLRHPMGFPGGTSGKELAFQSSRLRDTGSIPGLGRSPGDEHGNPPQCSCLENPKDRGAWRATVCEVTKSQTQLKQLSTYAQAVDHQALLFPGSPGQEYWTGLPFPPPGDLPDTKSNPRLLLLSCIDSQILYTVPPGNWEAHILHGYNMFFKRGIGPV